MRLETDALALVLANIRIQQRLLVVSPVHWQEIVAIANREERQYLAMLLHQLGWQPNFDLTAVRQRAEFLAEAGLGVADAAHVAFAEAVSADFVTVDDKLIKKCQRLQLPIWSGSLLAYCEKEQLR